MSKKSINIGVIGLGTVGGGTVRIVQENGGAIRRRLGVPVTVKKIADLDIKRDRGIPLRGIELTVDAQRDQRP